MWLNPVVDKFRVFIGGDFFNNSISKRYDNYLYNKNYPLKNIEEVIYESINNVNIPGFQLPELTIEGLSNIGNNNNYPIDNPVTQMTLPSEVSQMETFESQEITLSMRNNILNWLYIYEIYYNYFSRDRKVNVFPIYVTILDSAEIEIMRFEFGACYVSGMAGLEFATNNGFRESRIIEARIRFNSMNIETLIPDFKKKDLIL